MIVTLAFKKNPQDIPSKLICWWTKSPYYHIEIIIDKKWISSNPSVGGVNIKELRPLHETNWTYVDVKVADSELYDTLQWIRTQQDKSYDWCGIFCAQTFRTSVNDEERWFCSELVGTIMDKFGDEKVKGLVFSKLSPGDLFRIYD